MDLEGRFAPRDLATAREGAIRRPREPKISPWTAPLIGDHTCRLEKV